MSHRTGRYSFTVEPFTEDCLGNLSWGRLGNLLLRCASMHAGEHGFGFKDMMRVNHVWVLSRLTIEMDSLPRTGETFFIETWVDKVYRQFTDRHFSILRPDGTAYGHATSIWALIDWESRQAADLRGERMPETAKWDDVLVPERPNPIASSRSRARVKNPVERGVHTAAFTDLDINGHFNSIRYLELALNLFTPESLKARPIRRIDLAFAAETYCGEQLHIFTDADVADPMAFEMQSSRGKTDVRGCLQQTEAQDSE